MTEEQQYRAAYNAHESAEAAMYDALYAKLREQPTEALVILGDPAWRWETRSHVSDLVIEAASEVLAERTDSAVASLTA